ncbi:MAG: hypothetical protein AABZ12_14995 [Planctomycetota bacterium]
MAKRQFTRNIADASEQQAHGNLDRWKRLIQELPPVRDDKVQAVRSALSRGAYDTDETVDETVRRLGEDIGAMLRCHPSLPTD